jgi:cytochrome c-type biogenesis protein CcmF
MIPELGHAALCLSLSVALLLMLLPLVSRLTGSTLYFLSKPLATILFMLISSSFVALMYSYAISDFTVLNVIENSHTLKPMIYKITGTWGNHEGSMLLWVWVLALFGFLVAFKRYADRALQSLTLCAHGAITSGFLFFILLTSNPFIRVFPPPADGEDLNPLLQDIGLAMHPPMLYVGYVGFGIVFAHAIAGMWQKRIDNAWAVAVHPWILITWATLTAGIGLGSWWAYRELGWGGWWFWDPVENVSLLPWLAGGALMHANMVLAKHGSYARWVALLAIFTFAMSLLGTFIVRSGLITSVHAFASDPERGMFILAYVTVIVGIGLALFARYPVGDRNPTALLSRASLILLNNVLMVSAACAILLAILYPVFCTLMGLPAITVGPPYFHAVIVPLCMPLLALAAIAPLLPWHDVTARQLQKILLPAVPVIMASIVLAVSILNIRDGLALLAVALVAWLFQGCALAALRHWRAIPAQGVWGKCGQFPLRSAASILGHTGLAVFVAGVIATSIFKTSHDAVVHAGQNVAFENFRMHVEKIEKVAHENYIATRTHVTIFENGKRLSALTPEIRFYPVREQETTESSLDAGFFRDVYAVIGRSTYRDATSGEPLQVGLRIYIVPGQFWIWLGFAMASFSGMLAMFAHLRKAKGTA